jgi:cell division protein FtsZ
MIGQQRSFAATPGITIFGVGGAGGNAVSRLFRRPDSGLKVFCANTDRQALRTVPEIGQIQLGTALTGGLGAGARPEIGRAAAEEAMPAIIEALQETSLCIIAAGLGGGTGTGAAPIIARAARDRGILTIGVATKPFAFEGQRRARVAEMGAALLRENVDAMVTVCNENLFRVIGRDTTFRAALDLSDSIVCDSATDFAALIAGAGPQAMKRVSFADLRTTLTSGGRMVIGYGEQCSGVGRALNAACSALNSPLLEDAAQGAERLLVTIAGGPDLSLFEVEEAIAYLRDNVHPAAELIWGSVMDPMLDGRVRVGIVAAGLPETAAMMLQSEAKAAPVAADAAAAPFKQWQMVPMPVVVAPPPPPPVAAQPVPAVAVQPAVQPAIQPVVAPKPEPVMAELCLTADLCLAEVEAIPAPAPVVAAVRPDPAPPAPAPLWPVAEAMPVATLPLRPLDVLPSILMSRPVAVASFAAPLSEDSMEATLIDDLAIDGLDRPIAADNAGGLARDTVADRPVPERTVWLRNSPSLIDRLFFVSRDAKRAWRHRALPPEPKQPRQVRVIQPMPKPAGVTAGGLTV